MVLRKGTRTHFVSLGQHLSGVGVERDKLVGVLDSDGGTAAVAGVFRSHPLGKEKINH